MSAPVSPKVTAASLTATVTLLVVTFILNQAPILVGHSDLIAMVVTAAITGAAAWVAGYLRKAVVWAELYIRDHKRQIV
jgi:hypothetical protein